MSLTKKKDAPAAENEADEIEQIMNEIESLQLGMTTPDDSAQVSANADEESMDEPTADTSVEETPAEEGEEDIMKEFQSGGSDASMEETLAELHEDESSTGHGALDEALAQTGTEDSTETATETETDFAPSDDLGAPAMEHDDSSDFNDSENGQLSMTLQGSMTLKLKYELEGQEVSVQFSDQTLRVTLADGTEFKIPMRGSKTAKKAKTLRKVA